MAPASPDFAPIAAEFPARTVSPDIVSQRLDLIAITPEMLRADFARSPGFGQLIHAAVPTEWPPEGWDEDAYHYLLGKMEEWPDFHGWSRYIALKATPGNGRTLVGGCGLLGPVEFTDDPEIGYGLLPGFHHRGYATEAVAALVGWIFSCPHVRSVNAQTLPGHGSSLRVLARSGFEFAGPGHEEATVLYRKMREGEGRQPAS